MYLEMHEIIVAHNDDISSTMTGIDTDRVGLELHTPGSHHSLLLKQGQPERDLDPQAEEF